MRASHITHTGYAEIVCRQATDSSWLATLKIMAYAGSGVILHEQAGKAFKPKDNTRQASLFAMSNCSESLQSVKDEQLTKCLRTPEDIAERLATLVPAHKLATVWESLSADNLEPEFVEEVEEAIMARAAAQEEEE